MNPSAPSQSPNLEVKAGDIPTGNTFNKYESTNPVVRSLMKGFETKLEDLFQQANPQSILDVGCGEGVLTSQWAQKVNGRVVGVDLDDPGLKEQWEKHNIDNLEFKVARGETLPFSDNEFDTACAIEVLEHVEDPEKTLAEMARCASRHLLLSVPREPLWRMTNVARGAYLKDMGNTPGHVNHWSKNKFIKFASHHGKVIEVRSPFPWTQLLVAL